jgi:serine/threonine protein kinase
VVTVHDVLNEDGATYIVMELVEAPTLADVVRSGGPLPPERIVDLADRVLSALEAAHTAGIVHRDVKPSNILVPSNGRAKLTDFGIAQAVDDPKLTNTGTLIGSPGYLAPERVHGGEATAASDLWALGAVLFFAAEGYPVYERQTTPATLHAVVTERPALQRTRGTLATIIIGLLIPEPENRFNAAQTRALLHVPDGVTMPVQPHNRGTALYPTAGPVARRRRSPALRWTAAIVAVLVAAGLVIGGFAWGHGSANSGLRPANEQPTLRYGATDAQLSSFGLSNNNCANGKVDVGNHYTSGDSIDCGGKHDFQVFDSWTAISDDSQQTADYPNPTVLAQDAESGCTIMFQSSWVTVPDKQDYDYLALVPSANAWETTPTDSGNNNQTRTVLCVLWKADGSQLTGSALAHSS